MLKKRVNKFIFNEENAFVRIKTLAKDLRLQKSKKNKLKSENGKSNSESLTYFMEFKTKQEDVKKTLISVSLIKDYKFSETIFLDAKKINSDICDLSDLKISTEVYGWGTLMTYQTSNSDSNFFYYLSPENKGTALRVGPVSEKLEKSDFEIDWINVEWGIE